MANFKHGFFVDYVDRKLAPFVNEGQATLTLQDLYDCGLKPEVGKMDPKVIHTLIRIKLHTTKKAFEWRVNRRDPKVTGKFVFTLKKTKT